VRDLILLAMVYASLPVILFRPFFGLMVYAWLSYMRPQDLAWATSRNTSLAEYVAIATAIGLVLALGRERPLTLKLQTVLLILLVGWISLSVYLALQPELSSVVYGHYWKAILIAVLMTGMVRTRDRTRYLFILVAFSIGLLGAKYGLFGLLRGGTRFDDGPGGMMSDNNSFAVGLNMALPLLVGIVTVERHKWLRAAALGAALLSILTIFFTFSRGGLLTLIVVGALLVWRSQRRSLALAVVALGVGGFLLVTSDSVKEGYFGRAESITSYEEDGSAMGRINAWKTALRVWQDYPLHGVGPENFQVVFERYSPDSDRFRVAHNAYLQLLSECGWPALALFLLVLGSTLWRLEGLKRRAREPWVEVFARMLQVSIAAYMTGSMFLNMAYFELIYGLIGLAIGLEVAAEREGAVEPARAVRRATGEVPWWKQRPALPTMLPGEGAGTGAAREGNL
jgi:probable O-glycosylation ligase (exosortase A-associated)